MKILIIGNGGREHAIGWKVSQDHPEAQLFFAKGNAGTAQLGTNIHISSIPELVEFAKEEKIDLTIVGPENELVNGIVDAFQQKNLPIFGPHQEAAQLEGSKVFAKDFMHKYGVKTAAFQNFKYYIDAKAYIEELDTFPVVIKASGLAAGKGVIIAEDKDTALLTLKNIMIDEHFGNAGNEVVIEEYLQGFEASILSIYNGNTIVPFISAKDHKKIGEGETGLNTGGMGVVAPNPLFTDAHFQAFEKDILLPTQQGLAEENLGFAGVIFFGLMITEKGVYLLEYNLRFGDPETQAVLPLLESDLVSMMQKSLAGESFELEWKNQKAVCVVMASGGYPLEYENGFEISGLNGLDALLFFAGVSGDDPYYTNGGRVLSVVGLGNTLKEAQSNTYENIQKIRFDYQYYRKDIGG